MASEDAQPIKCPMCGKSFSLREALEDPLLRPIGMRIDASDPRFNLYFFQHDQAGCGTSIAVDVELFRLFLNEPVPPNIITGTEPCELRCVDLDDYAECRQNCAWAPYRRLLIRMMKDYENCCQEPSADQPIPSS